LSSQNNFPSFRSDVAFNYNKQEQTASPRFKQSTKSDQTFQENMQPNALNFKSNEHPASKELREVKSLLKQAMQEIGVKNQIIEKFTDFKERIEQMKNEEIVNLKSMFEQVRKKDEEAYSDHIRDLNDQIEEEKRTNDELMDMMGNKLNEDSMIDASHEELGDFKQQIFHKDQIINDVQSKNVELSKKLDMI